MHKSHKSALCFLWQVRFDGKAAIVVQDAESYQHLLELKERAEVVETLRQRLATRGQKKERTAEDFFAEFFAKNDISKVSDP